jgi:hypothetical protein
MHKNTKQFVIDIVLLLINPIFWWRYLIYRQKYDTKLFVDIYPEQWVDELKICDKVIFTITDSLQLERINSIKYDGEKIIRIYFKFQNKSIVEYKILLKTISEVYPSFKVIPFSYPHRPNYCGIKSIEQCQELWDTAKELIPEDMLCLYATGDQDLWWGVSLLRSLSTKPQMALYENYHDSSATIVPCEDRSKWKPGWPPSYPTQKHFAFCYPKWVPFLGGKRQNVWGTFLQKSRFFDVLCRIHNVEPLISFDYAPGDKHEWMVNEDCMKDYTEKSVNIIDKQVPNIGWIYQWVPRMDAFEILINKFKGD